MDNGLPIKRFDHVVFPELIQMDAYVYRKRKISRPNSLDLDLSVGLVGGKNVTHSVPGKG